LPETLALVESYRGAAEIVRNTALNAIVGTFETLGDYHEPSIDAFVQRAAPLLDGASTQIASLTDAYVAAVLDEPIAGVRAELVTSEALRGVDSSTLLERSGQRVWRGIGDDLAIDVAVDAGIARLGEMVSTNLQLAHTHSAQWILGATHTSGYQRVPRGFRSCALCLLASTQRYHSSALMPIHPGCHCAVLPFQGPALGHVIDPEKRDAVYDRLEAETGSRSLTAEDYRRYVVVHEHGEIGPVLYRSDDYFTGPHALSNA